MAVTLLSQDADDGSERIWEGSVLVDGRAWDRAVPSASAIGQGQELSVCRAGPLGFPQILAGGLFLSAYERARQGHGWQHGLSSGSLHCECRLQDGDSRVIMGHASSRRR